MSKLVNYCKKITLPVLVLVALSLGSLGVAVGSTAVVGASNSAVDGVLDGVSNTGQTGDLNASISTIIDVLLFLVGVIAVLVIIVAGLKFVTANGDSNAVKSARDTMLYAVIGLVVAIVAYAIVKWLVATIK